MSRWSKIVPGKADIRKLYDVGYLASKDYELRNGLFNQFLSSFDIDAYNVDYAFGVNDFGKLLNADRSFNAGRGIYGDKVPDADHARIFRVKGTNQYIYVNQPYQHCHNELEEWCNKRDVIYVELSKKYSWYYPGHTELILLLSNDAYIDFLCTIKDYENEMVFYE